MTDAFLQELLATDDLAEKAAIIAEALFKKLPEQAALVARRCALFHWFDLSTIEALASDIGASQNRLTEIFEQITSLPFVETLAWGLAFHGLTREGLIKRYALSQPKLLITAAKLAAGVYQSRQAYGIEAAEAFFCHVVAGQQQAAIKLLSQLFEEAAQHEDWPYISGLEQMQKEAEQLPFVRPLPLTEGHWVMRGIAHRALGKLEMAAADFNRAIAINDAYSTRLLLGALYAEQQRYEEALSIYTHLLQWNPTLIQPYINRGIIYLQQHRYEEAIQNFSRATRMDPANVTVYAYYIQALIDFFRTAATSNNPLESYAFRHFYTEEAAQNLSRAIQMDPAHTEAYTRYIQALVDFFQAATTSNNPLERYALIYLYAERKLPLQELQITQEVPEDPLEIANFFSTLAMLYTHYGRYKDAEPLLQETLTIRKRVLGSEHPDTGRSLEKLAVLYINQGRYKDAAPLLQQALTVREHVLGSEHPDTAESLNDLATLYVEENKYAEAEKLYQHALSIRIRVLGREHPDTAQSLNKLGILYYMQKQYDQADSFFRQALTIREQVLSPEHPDTAQSLNNLAIVYHAQKKYQEAMTLYQRARAIREQVLGPEHPGTAESLNNLALLYADQKQYEAAEELYQRALTIHVQILRLENPDTAQILNNLAVLTQTRGRYAEAEILYQHALTLYEQALGADHPRTVTVRKNYETILRYHGTLFDSSDHRSSKGYFSAMLGNA